MIATPAAHEAASVQFARSLFETAKLLQAKGIESVFQWLSLSDIEIARNMLAGLALADRDVTHVLFIDADMSFPAGLIGHMLDFDRDFVSTAYPRRELDLQTLLSDAKPGEPAERVVSRNLRFIVAPLRNHAGDYSFEVERGFAKVRGTGMGLCLLKRGVFEEMIGKGVVKERRGRHPLSAQGLPYYGFFDKLATPEDDVVGEDFSFCRRWVDQCGGEIWAFIEGQVSHHGTFRFTGAYSEKVRAGRI